MPVSQNFSLFFLRVSLGGLYLYAGITKLLDPQWSAAGYLKGAKSFVGMYQWFVLPDVLPIVNFLNEWGLTLLGISLILGIFVRLSSMIGIVVMAFYYFAVLSFPYVGDHFFLADQHIVYVAALASFATGRTGRVWGLDKICSALPICEKYPKIRDILG